MSIITATYATIARELWGQQAIGAVPTAVQIETIKSKRRVSQNKHFHFIENTKCAIELFCKYKMCIRKFYKASFCPRELLGPFFSICRIRLHSRRFLHLKYLWLVDVLIPIYIGNFYSVKSMQH